MSSVRSFSTAVSAEGSASWTHVGRSWGSSMTPAPAPILAPAPATRAFSFASAALDASPMPPRAPSSRTLQAVPPPPKTAGAWTPKGAVTSAKETNKAPNLQSMSEFPSLGGGAAARPLPSAVAPATKWSHTVAEASARVDAGAAVEAAAAEAYRRKEAERIAVIQRRSRLANIGSRCFDDSSAVCDTYPDEDEEDTGAAGYYREEAVRPEDIENTDGEFNSDLAATRRAGDKGDW